MGRTIAVRRDDGFSVVEVVVAASILFFVLTAVVGLVGVSSAMTVQAKQKSVLTNAVASYIDEIRAYSWEDIAASDADGDSIFVPSSTTRVVEGVTVTFGTSVESRQVLGDEYMKNVRITATAVLGGQTQTYTTRVAIRNPRYNRTLTIDPDVPTITFETPTPEENEVLFLNERLDGGVIRIRTRAESPVATIAQVRYEVAGRLLRDQLGSGGDDAIFTPSPPVAAVTNESYWDTRQEGVLDGVQTVVAIAEDDQARVGNVRREFIVDNHEPLAPGTPQLTALGSRGFAGVWGAARDGGTDAAPFWASQYRWVLSKEPTAGATLPTSWPQVAVSNVGAGMEPIDAIKTAGNWTANVSAPGTVTPFGRYWLRVYSGSPRGIGGAYADSAFAIARPEIYCLNTPAPFNAVGDSRYRILAKTTNPKGWRYECEMWISKPSFPVQGMAAAPSIQYSDNNDATFNTVVWGGSNVPPTIDTAASTAAAYKVNFTYFVADNQAGGPGKLPQKVLSFRAIWNVTPMDGVQVGAVTNTVGRTGTAINTYRSFDPYGFLP